ncbi:acetylxylan esterase precursor [Microthyrium microscopicum]|uniref:Acetylxylan esterase n=1 Tax=Microthyrium microscopicum TaxID=703497 RepID=A0A6A6U5P6_9PEZI|nr:acetylxylan esterase precursor [Microthyrium microscopicum]
MKLIAAAALSFAGAAVAQGCAKVYVFGARETTVSPGYGSAGALINQIKSAYPGTGSEAIVYPACGGQSSCGGMAYDASASKGTQAVVTAVTNYNKRCPDSQIILVGYSQGGQIMDNAVCGGAGATLSGSAMAAVKAAIFMGDPHNIAGLPYNVGTCKAQGFSPRKQGFTCAHASIIQSYCDAADPYCCKGNNQNTHQGYVREYGSQAMAFIKSKVK